MRYSQTHLQEVFADLERQGLSPTHSAMAHNIIQFRIRGNLPYLPKHKAEILKRIKSVTPGLVAKVEKVLNIADRNKTIFDQ